MQLRSAWMLSAGAGAAIAGGAAFTLTMIDLLAPYKAGLSDTLISLVQKPFSTAWCVLIAAQVTVWIGLLPSLLSRLREYWGAASPLDTFLLFTGLALVFSLFMFAQHYIPDYATFVVPLQKKKVGVLTFAGFLLALLSLFGMHWCALASERAATAQQLAKMSSDQAWFLSVAGIIVGAATLATSALRLALLELNPKRPVVAPPMMSVLVYGAVCSGIIALVFIPAQQSLAANGRKLLNRIAPPPEESVTDWLSWREQRAKLETALGIAGSAWERLRGGMAILAPLLASSLSVLIAQK